MKFVLLILILATCCGFTTACDMTLATTTPAASKVTIATPTEEPNQGPQISLSTYNVVLLDKSNKKFGEATYQLGNPKATKNEDKIDRIVINVDDSYPRNSGCPVGLSRQAVLPFVGLANKNGFSIFAGTSLCFGKNETLIVLLSGSDRYVLIPDDNIYIQVSSVISGNLNILHP